MRVGICLAFLNAFSLAQSVTAVEGVVTNTVTGAAIVGVDVTLTSAPVATSAQQIAYRTATDPKGAFRFDKVKEGEYAASFEHKDFMLPRDQSALRPFRITNSMDTVHLHAQLAPLGKLSGRVLDEDGTPVGSVTVELIHTLGGAVNLVETDPQGRFFFQTLHPGSYHLLARTSRQRFLTKGGFEIQRPKIGLPFRPRDEHRDTDRWEWVPTYFPSGVDRKQAMRIIVHPGAQLPGFDIRLRAAVVRHVRGVVRDDEGRPVPGIRVALETPERFPHLEDTVSTAADGSYAFEHMRSGEWRLHAETTRGAIQLKGFTQVFISNRDVDELEIRLNPPFSVEGHLEKTGEPGSAAKTFAAVYLMPLDAPPDWLALASPDETGTFRINDVYQGRYRIQPPRLPAGFYIDSVLVGGRDVTSEPIDLAEGAPPIKMIYKSDGGRIRGAVEKQGSATVVAVPQDEGMRGFHFIRSEHSDSTGNFEIHDLRPGSYYLFAFDRADIIAFNDRGFFLDLLPRAASVRVGAGDIAAVELKITSWPNW